MEDYQSHNDSHITDDSLENIENQYLPTSDKFENSHYDENRNRFNDSSKNKKGLNTTKSSTKVLSSIDPYNTPHGLRSSASTKMESSYDQLGGYGYSKIKSTIDETFHKGYKEKLAELETLKYNYDMLQGKHQASVQRVETLEKENKVVSGKYQKLKDMYRVLKEQHYADRGAMKDAKNENIEYTKNIDELENQLQEALESKKNKESENKQLTKKIDKLTRDAKEESRHYAELERNYKEEIEKLQKEKTDVLQKFKEMQRNLHSEIDKLNQQKKQVVIEKDLHEGNLQKLQGKYTEITEMNKRLKDQILQNRTENEDLQSENKILKAEVSDLQEKLREIFEGTNDECDTNEEVLASQRSNEENEEIGTTDRPGSFEQTMQLLREKYEEESSQDKAKINSLSAENKKLKSENEYLTKAIDSVQEEYLDLKNSIQEEKKKSEPNQDLYNQPHMYLKEIEELKTQVRELEDQKNKIMYESNKVKFDYGFLEGQMTEFQETIYRLESHNEKLQRDLEEKEECTRSQYERDEEEKQQFIQEIRSRDEEIIALKSREKGHIQTIKELELILEDTKLHQAENEQRNRLTYSNVNFELSETLESQRNTDLRNESRDRELRQQEKQSEHLQQGTNHHVQENSDEHSEDHNQAISGNLPLKPSLLTVNYEVQRLTEKYQDIKNRYENLHNQKCA